MKNTAISIKVSSIPIGFLLKLISKEILVLKKYKNIYNYTYILELKRINKNIMHNLNWMMSNNIWIVYRDL